ncbi:MAG: GNAT family N-acetyltransferase [Ginsengibacter sp.]
MISIRKAEKDDLFTVHNLAHEIWPFAYGEILGINQLDYMLDKIYCLPSLEHQYNILKHHFILVLDNEIPVGFASFSPQENPAIYHLNKIYLLPSQQGKNIGKKIINYVCEEVKKAGGRSLQLNVNRYNKALHFYEKQGFKIIGNEDIDIGNGYFMNDYVMEMVL